MWKKQLGGPIWQAKSHIRPVSEKAMFRDEVQHCIFYGLSQSL